MSAVRTIRYFAWAVVAVALLAIGYTAWTWQGESSQPMAAATIGGPFTLTNQHGDTVTEASLKGHPSAIFFGYTFCPDVCPTTLFEMTNWLDKLGAEADELKVYFVTVDPERDTQQALAAYLQAFDPRIVGLTGTPEAVEEMTKAYRVYARKVPLEDGDGYIMDHTASIYLLDSNGTLMGTLDYHESEETALTKLRRLIETS